MKLKLTADGISAYGTDENGMYISVLTTSEFYQNWLSEGNEPEPADVINYTILRSAAYATESDPLKIAIENEALYDGLEPDYTLWLDKVAEIKTRYPKPQ